MTIQDTEVRQEDRFLIVKRGLYYRPDSCGYTGLKREAGRYPASYANARSGETSIHEDDAPEYSSACWEETRLADKDRQIAELLTDRTRATTDALERAATAQRNVYRLQQTLGRLCDALRKIREARADESKAMLQTIADSALKAITPGDDHDPR